MIINLVQDQVPIERLGLVGEVSIRDLRMDGTAGGILYLNLQVRHDRRAALLKHIHPFPSYD
jgi:hypothetical protein